MQEGYLDDELEKGRGVINGEDDTKAGKRLLPWLYTQDSEQEVFTNPKSWMKSNPTLGVIKKAVSYTHLFMQKFRTHGTCFRAMV